MTFGPHIRGQMFAWLTGVAYAWGATTIPFLRERIIPYVQRSLDRPQQVPDIYQPAFIDNVCDLMKNQQICTMFSAVDADGSGEISNEELEQVVTMLNLSERKGSVQDVMRAIDRN